MIQKKITVHFKYKRSLFFKILVKHIKNSKSLTCLYSVFKSLFLNLQNLSTVYIWKLGMISYIFGNFWCLFIYLYMYIKRTKVSCLCLKHIRLHLLNYELNKPVIFSILKCFFYASSVFLVTVKRKLINLMFFFKLLAFCLCWLFNLSLKVFLGLVI